MSLPFTGQCVLLTGAGGSIGAALVKEIVPHRPRSLVLLDHSEGNLHQLNFELSCLPDASFHRKRVVRLAPLLVRKPGSCVSRFSAKTLGPRQINPAGSQ